MATSPPLRVTFAPPPTLALGDFTNTGFASTSTPTMTALSRSRSLPIPFPVHHNLDSFPHATIPSSLQFFPRTPSEQPVGILYRPSENKMKNAKPKDYLGKAKLVAAESVNEAYTTFTGVTRMQQGFSPSGAPLDRASDTNLAVGGASKLGSRPVDSSD